MSKCSSTIEDLIYRDRQDVRELIFRLTAHYPKLKILRFYVGRTLVRLLGRTS